MMDKWQRRLLFAFVLIASFYSSNGCWMEGVDIWALQVSTKILDVHRGDVFNRATLDIEGISSYSFFDALNGGPYLTVSHSDNRFIIATNDAFEDYEEYETEEQMSVTVNFICTGGTTGILVFVIEVEDTNNNAPQFLPSNSLSYTIFTPTPPGITITGCLDGIVVRDIDLTTQRIDFTLEENPYFEIEYDAAASTTAKEFVGIIRTTTFIRTLPEPISLTITATDVDLTNDPPLSTSTTVTITADTEFEFPEEPVFTQAFYLANYVDGNQLTLAEPISLLNGFDELVQFSLEGEYSGNFALTANGNLVSITVVTPLPATLLRERQIFLVVRAEREYTSGDSATIVVQLPEEVPLEFERAYYEGTIESNILSLPELTLARGYEEEAVYVEVFGEYASFFTATVEGNTITLSMAQLTDVIINENNVISLEIVASTEFSSARSIVTLEIIKDDNVTPVFSRPMYTGSYNIETGLTIEQIVFDQGYDETVELFLEGDYATLFTITQEGPVVTLTTTGIPPEIHSQQRILLTLQATKPRTVGANAAIVITLPAARELGFEDSTYRGTLQGNTLSLEPIVLSTGFDENVAFFLQGELVSYFTFTVVQNQVTINLQTPIPDSIIQENNLIIFTVEASGLNALSTTSMVLVDIIKEDITTPVFSRNIYYGTYQSTSAVNIENINLAQGYDYDVTFDLQGDHAEYFQISNIGNNVVVSLRSTIPEEVIYNEKIFLFNVVANKPFTVGANAAVLIQFPSELTEPVVMRFAQNTYEAAIENGSLRIDDIVLNEGYQAGTEFLLTGEYSTYFTIRNFDNAVILSLDNPLPVDEIISEFILLELEARRERAITAWTNIVIDIVKQETSPLVFTQAYYIGVYDEETNILSAEVISLQSGYDETVTFLLEGDLSFLFTLTQTASNIVHIAPVGPLPSVVIDEYNHLLFAVVASKADTLDARAAISIDIQKVTSNPRYIQFSRDYYAGSIEGATLVLDNLYLDGYSDDVNYTFSGDYADYFQLTALDGTFTLLLIRELPAEVLETRNILIYTLEANVEDIRTHTTIVLEIIKESTTDITLAFEDVYYIGSYTETEGLLFNAEMRVSDASNLPITYSLDGAQSEWFELVQTENTVSLRMTQEIPTTVIESNSQLIFIIKAESPELNTATATIIITITRVTNAVLGFDQVTYVGTIQNTAIILDAITLIEGYTQDVTFSLHGDLANYFALSVQGAGVVTLTLPTAIPDQIIPSNRLIVLEIRASAPQAVATYATIVLEVVLEDDQVSGPQLVFDATYYTGSYTATAGLSIAGPIVLTEGYDQSVQFVLEGDHAQWFDVEQTENSLTLRVSSAIPVAVLTNNVQLVFVIAAQRSGSDTARATIVIALPDEYTESSLLGFDQVTYVGTIQNTAIILDPITLIEGYTQDVTFSLHGDLANYFALSVQGAGVVTLTLPTAIPDQIIPSNRLIVLEIRASAPQAVATYATIVLEVVLEDDQVSGPQLVFDATYYTGSYTATAGLSMAGPIVLTEGYDQSVQFVLEGDHAQWFDVEQTENSLTLRVSSAIPVAVLTNNVQLVFVIAAQRSGSDTARATIVIALPDEFIESSLLGFDQVTYVGTIQNTAIILDPITLIEGYTQDVTFSLHGDLANYFALSVQGAGVVTLTLPTAIPDQIIPSNRLIVLEIRASAPQAVATYATIVLEVVLEDDQVSGPQLVFDATYYTGSYTATAGLSMAGPIVLTEGYDQSVQFVLEGDHAQWFDVEQTENSLTLRVSSAIPVAVLTNNVQLVFVIAAQRSGSDTARATIVIALPDEYTESSLLGFDQVTYVGTIQNTAIILDPITLIEGYTQDVTFSLHGDLANYFALSVQGAGVVTLTLPTAIPDQIIPSNRLIVLEIRASAPQAVATYATIVLEVVLEDDQVSGPQLVFDATYYTGSYTATAGLSIAGPIVLTEGYDQSVQFVLEGDHAQWFDVEQTENSLTLRVSSAIPVAVLTNNVQLVFVIAAQRSGSDTARATIVIALPDEYTESSLLGFDQVTYVGTIQNTAIILDPITLIEGYTQDVTFSLHGDLANYFALSVQGAGVVTLTLPTAIPDQIIPSNRLIVLEIRASAPQAVATYATIVLEVVLEDDQVSGPQLVFDATYYTGSYTATAGLSMAGPIVLTEGYDQSVQFVLEGDHAQWFDVEQTENSLTLRVSSAIPVAVLTNNVQLVFVIAAQRSGSDTARATIVIALPDEYIESSLLGFDQVTYVGTIQNTAIILDPITLIEGYTQDVTFSLHGDLANYFALSVQGAGVVTLTLPTAIPDQIIPSNRLIVLEIRASATQAVATYATIVLEVVLEDDQVSGPQLVFDATYYTGSYTATAGLSMAGPIVLTEGYDQSVQFVLEGDHAQWFDVEQTENSLTLRVSSAIPVAVLTNNVQLVFVIAAQRSGSDTARATIVIALPDEYTESSLLGFDQVTYVGTIQNTAIILDPITLIEGYTQDVTFSLHGDLANYFALSVQGAGVVTLTLPTAIPDQIIPSNRLIVLEIRASAPQAVATYATIVLEVVLEDDQVSGPQLVFDATYYTGSYTATAGLSIAGPIVLTEGYDQSVQFVLEGDHAQWFDVEQTENSLTLRVSSAIPVAVLTNNVQLVFVIAAQRSGSDTARATIVIALPDEYTESSLLGFDQVTYVGTIQNTAIILDPITLIEGYTQDVTFSLHGDLANYFALSVQGAGVVTLTLPTAIPDQIIPSNRLIVLEIRASAPQAVATYATIVLEVVLEDDQVSGPQLVFDATYYTGSYTATAGLSMAGPIVLTEGYDQSVQFVLEGDHAQWFDVEQTENSLTLRVSSAIPVAVLTNNVQLVFVIAAQRSGSDTARATIVIALPDEYIESSLLGFDQVTYVGTIQNTAIILDPITLIEGYTQDVTFSLHGDLANYFALSVQGAGVVTLTLPTAIPDQIIPSNRLIVLEIRASATQAVATYATIVLEVVLEDDQVSGPQLVFDATYYTGSYTATAGLSMAGPIVLTEGYDQSVQFVLEGDHAQWFDVEQTENSLTLRVSSAIPVAVLTNNVQLVFVIAAQRSGSDTARATIVIALPDEYTESSLLGFDQVTYVGTIQNTAIILDPITLIEGYTQDVTFSLHGDLANYFALSVQGAGVVTLTLPTAIPDQIIPSNRLIVLEIRASAPQAVATYATIVLEVVLEDDQVSGPQLVFDATYYTGSYTATAGLSMAGPIVLTEGYDQSVQFVLEGDHAQWFDVEQTENSLTLRVSSAIPVAVLTNNVQLVFVIAAQRSGSDTARATIVIALPDEYTESSLLGFDQVTYVGTIQNTAIILDPITLIEGYTQDVTFSLHGDLANYFALSVQGAGVVTLTLPTAIPDQIIPSNRLIVLEIRASAPQAVATYATIVLEVVLEDDQVSGPQLVFDATYYTGSYTATAGLSIAGPIVLTEGYDQSVQFVLEGDHAQWFDVEQTENSLTLRVSSAIPVAVLTNNVQLVFVIAAQRSGSDTARATIVIALPDEYTESSLLGFDQVTYVGTIQNTAIILDPITLIEGYTQDVTFSLHGDLANYFALSVQGAGVVTLTLPTAIPDQIIPSNRLIVLEIRASAPQAVATYATIVLEVVLEDDQVSGPQLVFDATYYTGSYTATAGLSMAGPIVLTEGYDQSVQFVLEGDHAQWFDVEQTENSLTLRVSSAIPVAVLTNNVQLVFVIAAQRSGSDTARATIVIALPDEYIESSLLGFDQVTYVGTIQNTAIILDPITLIEGYTQDVTFSLHGDLANYFALSVQGAGVVTLTLPTAIPDQIIPSNRLIVLEIRASATQAVATYATIVLEVVLEDDQVSGPQLVFDATYYTGSYTATAGLSMAGPIVLTEGYDQSVQFVLEGDHAQWFDVEQTENSLTLRVSSAIPVAVLTNNVQLVFVIAAQRSGSDTARATIVIALPDEYTESSLLGFDQVTYVGTIQNTAIILDPITLIEGYTQDVTFSLHGDLANYFALSVQGAGVVTLTLPTAIPDQIIPSNRLIVLEIRASAPQAVATYATIVLEVVLEDDQVSGPQLVFDATYYTGSYTATAGLSIAGPIVLTEGYDQSVQFVLEGDHAQWFDVEQTENSLTLRISSAIPVAVLTNNVQLVFVIAAQRSGSDTARATIVIALPDEYIESSLLGFDQVTYVGTIQNTAIILDPITLIEGYTQDVTFSLHGDLANYFALSVQGAGVVTLTLPTAIPDQIIPSNRLIVLEIRASATQAVATYATIVLEVVLEDDQVSGPQLVFDATYYTGSYTATAGLSMAGPIVLTEGYDQSVQFVLEGDHAQWFDVEQTENSLTLRVSSAIPVAVLTNNVQLVFVIAAQRSGSDTAKATIVIALPDEYTESSLLGFDQVTYVGTIQNTAIILDPITLIEGYTQDVTFSLHGDLANYFALSVQGAGVVTLTLPTAIPDQIIPSNRLIVLEIRASAPQAVATYATIVLEVVLEDDQVSGPQLVFDATYYTGSYTATAGLSMAGPIVLTEGYDQSVQFVLEGDHAQWFDVEQTENSLTLRVSSAIPVAVLTNNVQLVFVIAAQRSGSDTARATIVIALPDEYIESSLLGFDQVTYVGTIQNTAIILDPITLIEGYTQDVTFSLHGDLANYFALLVQGAGVVTLTLPTAIPDQIMPSNRLIVLEIRASAPQAVATYATIVLEVVLEDDQVSGPQLVFDATYYTGSYTATAGLSMAGPIVLTEGYDQSVQFVLEGDHAQWFDVEQTENSLMLRVSSAIPVAVLTNNVQLVFVIAAQRSGSDTARATIVIALPDEFIESSLLGFDQVTYVGTIQNTAIILDPITLIEGYTQDVTFSLHGDLANYFALSVQGAGVVTLTLPTAIPDQIIPSNRLIVLEIRASAPQAVATYATIVLEVVLEDDQVSGPQLVFDATYYTGSYTATAGLSMAGPIVLTEGYDQSVQFVLEGDHAQWFDVEQTENSLTLRVSSAIPVAVLTNNVQLVFVIAAQRSGSDTARATIVIALPDEYTESSLLGFDQVTYVGTIQNTAIILDPITLIEGYTQDVTFSLHGDLANYFALSVQGAGVVTLTLPTAIPDQIIPSNRLIVLEIRASAPQAVATYATIVLEVVLEDDQVSRPQLVFDATYYTGSYTATAGLSMAGPIVLTEGYDQSVQFVLEGDHAQWFDMEQTENSLTLRVSSAIPVAVLTNNVQLVFVIAAQRSGSDTARATIVIALPDDLQIGNDVSFDKLVYEGIIQLSAVQHESIVISNYNGIDVELYGEYSSLFVARLTDGVVTVQASGSVTLPHDVTQVTLELHAAEARAVLLLNIVESDVPVLPSVTFSSPSYVLNVDVVQTGYVGRVLATADNGEVVTYALTLTDAHLQARLSISNEGELYLSAPANSGVYTFQVIATTVITQAQGSATVYLSVEAITVCNNDEFVVPPLIILDRDEEEAHNNLVVLNTTAFVGCQFSLTNRWPLDQDWLYVDENGLHARSIDREHESIALMALSQVQVELILHCESDNVVRTKRSQRTDWLGPYDYGTSKWILTESILYNARRSLVNLIVNDINDNTPIFVGKESEPIAVGYPIEEIEERILPRSLAELQATDADVGINAALVYWSSEEVLAVAPNTGFVHVRNGAQLQYDQTLTVSATDQNGEGLTGEIQLIVKLLDLSNIAVVTVRDAFLDNENAVLAQLSEAVGYEIKALRSVVISDDLEQDENVSRKKRETDPTGASLQLYVYGLEQREPVVVDRLTTDINNNAAVASVISTVSLEDHLDSIEIIITERDIGLLVATIVLSVLLFIIIVLIAIWFFLRWRKNRNYDAFTDENSLASRRGSVEQFPKPENTKPRLNIEELRRSERRLQDMLNTPIEQVTVEAVTPRRAPQEAIVDLSPPETNAPIVIQSIDKLKDAADTDDEFGETYEPKRKSVVTFNENVEKIIHVEDDADTVSSQSGYEIYKL